MRLQNLSTINLSENNLNEIPAGFGSLPLTDINFAQNQLGNSNFAWLKQPTIQMSLKSINLSDNKVCFNRQDRQPFVSNMLQAFCPYSDRMR